MTAVRYVLPFREGGSLPGLVEADDLGMYVVKFRGAGQGLKVLVAEVICAGLARLLDIPTPDLVSITLPAPIIRYEADEEVQDLLNASPGTNLGVDYLPGAFGYDGSRPPSPREASAIMWLDALTANIDRTWSNPNLLVWGGRTWAIDHGAALYFHHSWPRRPADPARFAAQSFDATSHVLADIAEDPRGHHEEFADRLSPAALATVLDEIPEEWLEPTTDLPDPAALRQTYLDHLAARLSSPDVWIPGGASR
ncbi:hypothetical protein SAMN05421595_1250 [Austwickia chelonae]|nr:hypothetical protein SAMN05421595_1250 [Austwickia chelonae]